MATPDEDLPAFQVAGHYLGSAPVTAANAKVAHDALGLLKTRLQALQTKKIELVLEKQFGSRLSPASPVYQKTAAKLVKKGHDVTKGDPIDVRVHLQYISFVDHVHRNSTQLVVESVIFYNIATKEPDGTNVVCLIVDDDAGTICHALRLEEPLAIRLVEVLEKVLKGARKVRAMGQVAGAKKVGIHIGVAAGVDPGTITLGIGMQRRSSMKLADGVRRRGTVSLKGAAESSAQRTSSSYGGTFKSLGKASAAAAKAALISDAYSLGSGGGNDNDDDFDDELLAGIDETIFSEVQIVDANMDFAGTLQADGGEGDDELDLANFGFGDEYDNDGGGASTSATKQSASGFDDDDDAGFGFG